MEETKESILKLKYIFEKEKSLIEKVKIEEKEYLFDEIIDKEIKIKFNEIEKELGSKILKMYLINSYINEEHNFGIISGINNGILFPGIGYTRDIIFPENGTYKVEIIDMKSQEKKEFQVEGKRLLLINYSKEYLLSINGLNLTKLIMQLSPQEGSSQISVFDLENRIFFYKAVLPQQFDSFFNDYDKYEKDANCFLDEIGEFIKKKKFNLSEYKELFRQDKLMQIIFHKYNLPKKILENEYNKQKYFDFIFKSALYFVMCSLTDENEIKSIYNYFIDYKEKIENDLNLEYYMKNTIIIEFAFLLKKKGLEKFKKLNFKYYNTKLLEKDTILGAAKIFLEDFIKDIDETSPFIYPLILIDSGNYIYDAQNAYGYGLINKEILKSHLINIIPDIIITNNDNEETNIQALANIALGSVKLNLESKFLSPLKDYELNKKMENIDIYSNLILALFITLFHEILGHKKGGYSSKKDNICNSPNVFYDKKEKKILKLVNRNSLYITDNDIPFLRDDENEDAGHFLEYFIGKCEYGFYSEMIEIMISNNINLNFILNVNMWNKNIDIMRKYVKLKYIIYKNNKDLLDKEKYNGIDDEIGNLEKIIEENKFSLEKKDWINNEDNQTKNEEIINQSKKSEFSELKGPLKNEHEKLKNLSFEELQNIITNKNISEDINLYII